jgi:hypothetical protein
MADGEIIGTAHDHDELVAVLRQRKAALALSDAIVDELAGLATGHTGKLLGPAPVKTLGRISLSALLVVLALKLIVIEDPDQVARIGKAWQRRDSKRAHPASYSLNQARPLVLARAARKAAKARWAGKSAEERRSVLAQVRAAKASRRCARTDNGEAA